MVENIQLCPCGSGHRYTLCHGWPAPGRAADQPSDPRMRLEQEYSILGSRSEDAQHQDRESLQNIGQYETALSEVETYCFFIGYPRSGHTLIGALLDAHPNIVIAHELDVLKYIAAGFTRRQTEYLMIENAKRSAAAGRHWGPYSYEVPGQSQGQSSEIKVLGDKHGPSTTRHVLKDRAMLDVLDRTFEGRAKFIHVVRNPFDMIATLKKKTAHDLLGCAQGVVKFARTNDFIRESVGPDRIYDIWHERTAKDPKVALTNLCAFLGVNAPSAYLDACARLVKTSPHRSRDEISWPTELINNVEAFARECDFLAHYRFDA